MGRMSVNIAVLAALLVTYLCESDGRMGGARRHVHVGARAPRATARRRGRSRPAAHRGVRATHERGGGGRGGVSTGSASERPSRRRAGFPQHSFSTDPSNPSVFRPRDGASNARGSRTRLTLRFLTPIHVNVGVRISLTRGCSGMDVTLRALNRFGLGARRGERQRISDARGWLKTQLDGGAPAIRSSEGASPSAIGDALRAVRSTGSTRRAAAPRGASSSGRSGEQ